MSERFIKYTPTEKSQWLRQNHPNAYLLLSLIAERARRIPGLSDGLKIGECFIGDFRDAGIESERKYRTAKDRLVAMRAIEIVETCRSRKKSTTDTATATTTRGTKVKLLDNDMWDINVELEKCGATTESTTESTTDRRPTDDRPTTKEERIRKNKKEKEESEVADAPAPTKVFFREFVCFKAGEYEIIEKTIPSEQFQWMLDKLDFHLSKPTTKRAKGASCYAYFKKGSWLFTAYEEEQLKKSKSAGSTPVVPFFPMMSEDRIDPRLLQWAEEAERQQQNL